MESYNKMYQNQTTASPFAGINLFAEEEETPVAEPETIEEEETPVAEPETIYGRVVNCVRLNVREDADPDADVVCVIKALSDVEIVKEESTDEYYKVYLPSGMEGYCMRKYIVEVQP